MNDRQRPPNLSVLHVQIFKIHWRSVRTLSESVAGYAWTTVCSRGYLILFKKCIDLGELRFVPGQGRRCAFNNNQFASNTIVAGQTHDRILMGRETLYWINVLPLHRHRPQLWSCLWTCCGQTCRHGRCKGTGADGVGVLHSIKFKTYTSYT